MPAPTEFFSGHTVRLQILDYFGEPARSARAYDLLSRTLWNGAAVQPGTRGDVRRYGMSNDIGDKEASDELSGKVDALGPGWTLHAEDNSPDDWEQVTSPEEQALITKALAAYNQELTDLLAKPTPTTDDQKRIVELRDFIIPDLNDTGFLEQVPGEQMAGTNATGVYRSVSAPNIPYKFRSRFLLDQGRPITLWFKRWKPRPKQVNLWMRVDLGSRLRLEFRESDRAYVLRKNDKNFKADPTQYKTTDARRDELMAKKYLSPKDSDDIQAERDAIALIRKNAKDAGRKPTPAEKADIKTHSLNIKDIQHDHQLTQAEKDELKRIEAYLFHQQESLQLSQTSTSLIGPPFGLTMFDSGVGIVQFVLDIGTDVFVFEDRYTTARHLKNWLWGTPADPTDPDYSTEEKIEISGSGGGIAWRFGYVQVNKTDSILSQPIFIDPTVTAGDVTVAGIWTDIPPLDDMAVTFLFDAAPNMPDGWFQIGIQWQTDGKYIPLVFRASLQVTATERAADVIVWDSDTYPQAVITASPRLDEKRGRTYKVTIDRITGTEDLHLPDSLKERMVNLIIDGAPAMTGGIISNETMEPMGSVTSEARPWETTAGTADVPQLLPWTVWELDIEPKLRAARQMRFMEDVIFDSMDLGDAVRLAYRNGGYGDDELAGIQTLGIELPTSGPGEKARLRPSHHANRQGYIDGELIGLFGLNIVLWVDELGIIHLDDLDNRAVLPLNFTADNTDPRQRYIEDDECKLKRTRNVEGYYTQYRVEGAINPETKKPFVSTHTINEAVDERYKADPRHVGHHIPAEPIRNAALNSQFWVDFVLRCQLNEHGHPKENWAIKIPLNNSILPADLIKVNGKVWKVAKVPRADMEKDDMLLELETP